ncbi:MAG: hypothetical protein KC474_11095 [Cyanobacteria bacterium HKST-UBA04]|nr:hypothetical protein [Cyanobacteria bacterium HKST-UBA04]
MSSLSPLQPHHTTPPPSPSRVAFGRAGGMAVRLIQSIDKVYHPIEANRGTQLFVEDLGGFAVLRTLMDLFRQKFFKETQDGKKELNWAAARERVLLETTGTFPDPMAGAIGLAIGAAMDRTKTGFNNKMISIESLEIFDETLQKGGITSPKAFAKQLANLIEPKKSGPLGQLLHEGIANPAVVEDRALAIAKLLGQQHFDVHLGGHTTAVDTLMQEAHTFLKTASAKSAGSPAWAKQLQAVVKQTARTNAWRIPIAIAAGVAFNFVMPHLIHLYTKFKDGIDDFPGVKGLRDLHKTSDKQEGHRSGAASYMPYLSDSLKRGNLWPWLITALWLPVLGGVVDTQKLASQGLKAAINSPFKPGFLNRFLKIMQFGGSTFPWVGGGQAAMMYGAVVAARMATARTDVEFRERTVDGFLGWGIFIMGTPWIKKRLAGLMDKNLLKKVGGSWIVKSRGEVEEFMSAKTFAKYKLLGPLSTLTTIALLGIVEPYLSIRLTEWQTRHDQKQSLKKLAQKVEAAKAPEKASQSLPSIELPDGPLSVAGRDPQALEGGNHSWLQPTFFYQHDIWQHPPGAVSTALSHPPQPSQAMAVNPAYVAASPFMTPQAVLYPGSSKPAFTPVSFALPVGYTAFQLPASAPPVAYQQPGGVGYYSQPI